MTTRVVTVEIDDKLSTIKDIFDAVSFHHLLVVGGDKTLRGSSMPSSNPWAS